jgi:putative transposase
MKRNRHTEEQIISILRANERGVSIAELARQNGVIEQTIYRWKAKYSGMEVSEAKRLRELESENARLKKLLAESALDNAALKEILATRLDVLIYESDDDLWEAGLAGITDETSPSRGRPLERQKGTGDHYVEPLEPMVQWAGKHQSMSLTEVRGGMTSPFTAPPRGRATSGSETCPVRSKTTSCAICAAQPYQLLMMSMVRLRSSQTGLIGATGVGQTG